MIKHDPILVLEFGGMKSKKKDEGEDKDELQKEALVSAAKSVRSALKGSDDEALALALMDFVALCQAVGYEEEENSEEEDY